MRIVEDDLSSADVAELLSEHLTGMAEHSPPESIHAPWIYPLYAHLTSHSGLRGMVRCCLDAVR